MLVAVVMLFVIGAMAALSIDVVTLYTARSEAQLAADGAALAGARVLANSGATSDTNGTSMPGAWILAKAVAIQVATQNKVGGTNLTAAEVTLPSGPGGTNTDPTVTVIVQKNDLQTFFARIWGTRTLTVKASATAEAYNPSGLPGTAANPQLPVAPMCVKPWLLPNIDPSNSTLPPIFDTTSGAYTTTTLLGWQAGSTFRLRTDCLPAETCTTGSIPDRWRYYPGDPADFPPPPSSTVACNGCSFNNYQLSIAGCIQTPISCNSIVHIDVTPYIPSGINRDADAAVAVDELTHTTNGGGGDSVTTTVPPFQFLAGSNNPVVSGSTVMVSDSLVTVPVIDTSNWPVGFPVVRVIGFVQLFLLEFGNPVIGNNHIDTQVINLVGCGTGATGQPILGNGASPVAVRLISP
jgi:hypothetical protein